MKATLLTSSQDSITVRGVEESATSVTPQGSILVVARSGILAHTLPVARAGRPVAFNQDIKAIQVSNDKVSSEYVYWFLRGKESEVLSRGVKKGATVHSLQSGFLEQLAIPLAPIEEQRRIVDLLSRAENIVRMRKEAEAKAKEIIPALFIDMFVGGKHDAHAGLDGHRGPENAVNISSGLRREAVRTVRLGDVVRNLDSARKPVKASERAGMSGSIPYYGASGIIDHVNGFTHQESTLLVAEDGANLLSRSTPIAFQATGRYWVNNHAHVLGETQHADLTFLECHLNMRDLSDRIIGSAQPKLTQAALMNLQIPLPPIARQRAFADRAAQARGLEVQQAVATAQANLAFQSLLAGVFQE